MDPELNNETPSPVPETSPADPSYAPPGREPESVEVNLRGSTEAWSTPEAHKKVEGILEASKADPNRALSMDEIRAIMNFAPPLKAEQKKNETVQPVEVKTPTPETKQQPTTPAQPALDPNVAALVEALKSQTQSQTQTQPAQPAAKDSPKAEEPKQFYGGHVPALEIAPELAQAIFNSEDPKTAGLALNHLVNGMMNRVMQDSANMMLQLAQQLQQEIPAKIDVQQRGRDNTSKFFSKFPELNNPVYLPTVEQIVGAIVGEMNKQGKPIVYDDTFFDFVGKASIDHLEKLTGVQIRAKPVAAPAAQPKPAPQQASRPRFYSPGASRPPADTGHVNGQSADLRSFV